MYSSKEIDLKSKIFLALILGTLTVLGFAPFYYFPVPVITILLLFHLWRSSTQSWYSAVIGFSFGMGLFGAGVTWLYVSLHDFGGMPLPIAVVALLLLCAYLSLFPALTGWFATKIRHIHFSAWAACVSACWVMSEWLRGTLFTGFPWLTLGYSQVPASPLIGYAPILGVYGISLLLVFSIALYIAWPKQKNLNHYLWILGGIWVSGYGLQHYQWVDPEGSPITVSLLQGNISQDLKWREDHLVSTMNTYADLVLESNSRLIVTPEISIPLFYEDVPTDYLTLLSDHAKQNQGDVLIGFAETVPHSIDRNEYYNSMFSMGSSPEQRYRKHHLVPFGEFIPFKPLFGWIIQVLNIPLSDFSRGSLDQQPLDLAGQKIAINICYEDVFGEEIILQLPQASILVNVSNDAWFGRSIGPRQHLQISQMRALETGRYMLRATNTGVTAIINERGQIVQELEMFVTQGLHGTAQGFKGATPYVQYGNTLVLTIIGLCLSLGGFIAFFRKEND